MSVAKSFRISTDAIPLLGDARSHTTPIELDNGEVKVTVSMGASVYVKTSVIDVVEFVDSVDKFLFEAKQSGRNCICHIDYNELRSVTEIGAPERILRIARD